jgi:hypothetical protein
MTSKERPIPDHDLKIGAFTHLNWNTRDRLCTITIPSNQHSFESLEIFWKQGKWLNISISSPAIQIKGTERVRQTKFLGQIEVVQRVAQGALIKLLMYEDKPEIIDFNLDEGISKSAYSEE